MPLLKKDKQLHWTSHSLAKMRYYRLSEQRVKRILHSPARIEEGMAEGTIACMQPAGSKAHPYELWVMFQEVEQGRKVISAWRYPGKTKANRPLPEGVMQTLRSLIESAQA